MTAARDALADAAVALLQLLADDPTLGAGDLPADVRKFLAAQDPPPDPPRWSTRDEWRAALLAAAAFGLPAAMPPARYENRVQVRLELRAAAETALVELGRRVREADAALAGTPTVSDLKRAAQAIFGEGFMVVPRILLRNRDELGESLSASRATAAQLDDWLEGLAGIRDSCTALADVLVLADANGADVPAAAVAQLPHVDGEPWVGDRLPAGDHAGRLSLVVHDPERLPPQATAGAALLVDEWTEIVPSSEETTGVTIHYDQPDSTPPQCVLIAVPPVRRGTWRLGELAQTLHDTLELAKSRAVELEHLQTSLYGQLLPAISGELVPEAAAGASVSGERVILDFGANN